ncbi:hypothetical protein JHK85_033038 [Glycine max]|nr:hypothetical protein JHK85_033038 [Glycine max]KAG4995634.1 hypothetical protein JHK86_032461 [Glycine max]
MDHCHIGIAITHILCLFNDLVVALVSHTVISFAVISSLLSELQIQNSELGKLALSSALISDILCTIATAIGTAVMITENSNVKDVIRNVLALICLAIFNPLVCRPTMLWIIKHTPEGRAVKDEGPPLGSALVKKLNFLGTTFLLPIFVTISVLKADFFTSYSSTSVMTITSVVIFTHLVKIIACLPCTFPLLQHATA